jgi:hypothetical protein
MKDPILSPFKASIYFLLRVQPEKLPKASSSALIILLSHFGHFSRRTVSHFSLRCVNICIMSRLVGINVFAQTKRKKKEKREKRKHTHTPSPTVPFKLNAVYL